MKDFKKLVEKRPEALDFPDVPDLTPTAASENHLAAMEAAAPPHMRELVKERLRRS